MFLTSRNIHTKNSCRCTERNLFPSKYCFKYYFPNKVLIVCHNHSILTDNSSTAGAAAANEDATAKEGPKGRVDNAVETDAGKVRVSAAGMRSGEGSKAGMSASTTSTSTESSKVSNTTGTTFHIAAKAVVQTQTKTDLEPTLSRQHPVAIVELTTDRLSSADTKTKLVDCAVQVAVKTANKSVNANQDLANSRYDKQTQATDYINICLYNINDIGLNNQLF